MILLWIDDIRNPFDGWAERYAPFHPDEVCFDHDLGETGENERNGMTCAKAIIDYCIDHNIDAPAYNIQSSNPVGRENILSIIDGWHQFYINNKKE